MWVERSGAISCESCPPGCGNVQQRLRERDLRDAYNDRAFTPATVPVTTDEADPVALTPDARSDRYLWVELYTHLEVSFQVGFGDGK